MEPNKDLYFGKYFIETLKFNKVNHSEIVFFLFILLLPVAYFNLKLSYDNFQVLNSIEKILIDVNEYNKKIPIFSKIFIVKTFYEMFVFIIFSIYCKLYFSFINKNTFTLKEEFIKLIRKFPLVILGMIASQAFMICCYLGIIYKVYFLCFLGVIGFVSTYIPFLFLPCIIMLKNKNIIESIIHSFKLIHGKYFRVIFILIQFVLFYFMIMVFSGGINTYAGIFASSFFEILLKFMLFRLLTLLFLDLENTN